MKKYIASLSVICLCSSLFVAQDLSSSISKAVEQQARTQQRNTQEKLLSPFVQKEIVSYYNRTNFSDPQHESGWFRVHDFLTWLKANETQLNQEKIYLVDMSKGQTEMPAMHDKTLQQIIQLPENERTSMLMRAF